jgi:L-alanine-DL-glutamate epimerase-like enolase superfamily enzyme
MRIARVETLRLASFPQVLWVEVTTECGLTGLGETFFAPGAVEAFVHEAAAPALLGDDPRDVDRHAHRLGSVYVGSQDSGAEMRAASAIDLALWDILGQSLGAPVWRLFGGKAHASVPVYNTCAGYTHAGPTARHALFERNEDWGRTAEATDAAGPYEDLDAQRFRAGDLARSLLAEEIGAIKIWPFDVAAEASNGARITGAEIERALEPVRAIREAVGEAMEIMIELHGLWTLPCAMAIARALEPFRPAWIEEPIRGNDAGALATLAGHTRIPICASERLATRAGFRAVLERGAASVAMIDVAWCGGLGEARRIAAMADAWRVPVTLHDCTGPVVFAASCALSATLPHVNWQEMVRAYVHGWYREIVTRLPRVANGRVTALEGPGLGLALRPEIRRRPDLETRVSTA